VGGLLEAIEDGVNGVFVPALDVAALRQALEQLLGDPERRARLGAAARAYAVEHFSRETEIEALLAVYADASGRS
jgi:glycosyltransferase involved in cell wall biosynthesis